MSHYDTLKVTETATPEEIKKAYRRLASKHHPDKGGNTDEFQRIEEAYRVLSNPESRQRYDLERKGFGGGPQFRWNQDTDGMPDLDDIFTQFNFGFRNRSEDPFERMRQPRRNKDIRIEMGLGLEETLNPVGKTIQIQTTNGYRETININIPRGVEDGSMIKYPGLGDNFFSTLPRGDLYVLVRLIPHPRFRVHHSDIVCSLKISAYDAILGTQREITNLENKTFLLTVPPGTQYGTKLRIKDQGLYSTNGARGNLLVEVEVYIPKETDHHRKELLEELKKGQ
jgi:curved DNA-binding protein